MRSLCFEKMTLLSKTEKKARTIEFSPNHNVILGENDVGKSTLIKSLYHTLGADTPQLSNNRWKRANAIYCLRFSVDGVAYTMVRDERYFGLFDARNRLLGRFSGIARDGGVAARVNAMLGFKIDLETKNGDMKPAPPAYYYLPFYVDQDEGWNTPWSSFVGLGGVKDYRKNMVEYHLGIRPQAHYDVQKDVFALNQTFSELSAEKEALIRVRDSYRTKKHIDAVDLDPASFKAEAEELVLQYNSVYERQQDMLRLVKDARNRKLNFEGQISILDHAIHELDADYSYTESAKMDDVVDCPTCGTEFHNSIAERFGILDDIDYCRVLRDQRCKIIREIDLEIEDLNSKYAALANELSGIDELLMRKKDEISLADIVRSEGYKGILSSISNDLNAIDARQADIEGQIAELKRSVESDRDLKAMITEHYRARMKDALNRLNVHVLGENDYRSVDRVIKNNAIGSDLPRALLAQYMSYLQTMARFSDFTVCPMVIDSPLQQEQDETNASAIFDFIFSSCLEDQQLILGTVSSPEWARRKAEDSELHVITLDTEFGLLRATEYEGALATVGVLHEQTIASDEL